MSPRRPSCCAPRGRDDRVRDRCREPLLPSWRSRVHHTVAALRSSRRSTSPRSAARRWRDERSRSRSPAATRSCCSGRPAPARRCSPGRSRGSCPISTTTPLETLVRRPPVRTPHHTTSYAGMVGGGPRLSPGEVTLADQGVLVCDELPEFGRDVLEALRQPLEEGSVSVVRVGRSEVFPARFTFVAAMNPCPCGQLGSADRTCSCPPGVPDRYLRRVSGPLRDRIDLWVTVDRVAPAVLVSDVTPESSATVAARIALARQHQAARNGRVPNARVSGSQLRRSCAMDRSTVTRAIVLAEREGLSGRGTDRLLRVARTIA